ncbi:hypothetical protein QVD17_04618 [Tagetes erecta]|uniref:ATP synthase alpha subunit C-terminal domain-containing protein n=1 Tax=Tagetes erecta TaxID=13708 RepID=A0AAD8LI55_TARER|nr:hypothetical protein QVD17_04618 [Tagetes erecta]
MAGVLRKRKQTRLKEAPLPIEKQILVIYAAVNGFCDRMPLDRISQYKGAILKSIKTSLNEDWRGEGEEKARDEFTLPRVVSGGNGIRTHDLAVGWSKVEPMKKYVYKKQYIDKNRETETGKRKKGPVRVKSDPPVFKSVQLGVEIVNNDFRLPRHGPPLPRPE